MLDRFCNKSLDELCCYTIYNKKVSLTVPLTSNLGNELTWRYSKQIESARLGLKPKDIEYVYNKGVAVFNITVTPMRFEYLLIITLKES